MRCPSGAKWPHWRVEMTRTLEILEKLIAFPTVSRSSTLELISYVEDVLRPAGFTFTRIPAPEGDRAGLFARIGPETAGGLCLSAHADVVPSDGQPWTKPAFALTRDGDRVFGRGTTDMKGYLAVALALAEQVDAAQLCAPLSLCLSYDEEIGCVGIREMLPTLAAHIGAPDLIVVGEPTGLVPATAHKGKIALRLTCTGQAGHSALAPRFTNAIHVATRVIDGCIAWQERLAKGPSDDSFDIPYATVHIGKVSGGRALNIVPDSATLDMEIRHLPSQRPDDLLTTLQEITQQAASTFDDAQVTIEEITRYPGLGTAIDQRLRGDLGGHHPISVAFGTEAGFFAEMGLPTVVFGPGDMARDGHQPDEGLDLTQLNHCQTVLQRLVTRYCNAA